MVFVRAWDETQPADTLPANLYAQSLRQLKVDIRERMSAFGAGLKSARETPDAIFGNANSGVVFLAEDEGKLYRWDSAAWLPVTCEYQAQNQTFVDVSAENTDGVTTTVSGAIIDEINAYGVEVFTLIERLAGATAVQWKLRLGAALDVVDVVPSSYPALIQARFVIGGPAATLTTNNVFGYVKVNDVVTPITSSSLDVTGNWDVRPRSGGVPFAGDSFRTQQIFVRITR